MGYISEWLKQKMTGHQKQACEYYETDTIAIASNTKVEDKGDEYMTVYYDLLEKFGLDKNKISYNFEGAGPAVKMYEGTDNGQFCSNIVVYVPRGSQINCFRGSLAHELWHVKTNSDLIEKIGLDAFVELQRNQNVAKSLAFKTMAEFFSWKKAMEENEQEQTTITIASRMSDYKKYIEKKKELEGWIQAYEKLKETRQLPDGINDSVEEVLKLQEGNIRDFNKILSNGIDEYMLCDTLAAHCARCVFEDKTAEDIYICDDKNEKQLKEIAALIELNGKKDSLCDIDFEVLGNQILELLSTLKF